MLNNIDPKLLEAIDFFEKMLETMPGDRTGLEFLAVAYEQTGEVSKQVETLAKLSEVLLKENDLEHAAMIVDKLKGFEGNPQAQMAIRIGEMIIGRSDVLTSRPSDAGGDPLFLKTESKPESEKGAPSEPLGNVQSWVSDAAKSEIKLVWHWKDKELLPKDVCMELLHVFMDHPVTDVPVLVSALGLLEEQHPEYTMTAFEDLQERSRLPTVPLELFDVSSDVFSVLPVAYIQVKGVIPFGKIGGEYLIGVLNPLNKVIQDEIENLVGATCHFYFVHPAAWVAVTEPFLG